MTFFSAPDDAFAARGSLNAVTDFWARALDPKMFGLNGNDAAQAAEALWAWPMMVNRAMTDALAMWGGSFGALCVPAASAAKVAPAKLAPEKAPSAPKAAPKAAAKAAPAKVAAVQPTAVVTTPMAPVLELPPVILAEVAPAPAMTQADTAAPAAPVAATPATAAPVAAVVKATPVAPAKAAPVAAATPDTTAALAATVAAIEPEDFQRPKRIEKPKAVDDLKMISGVGPKIEKTLHGLGIYTFAQIAGWTPAEIAWVDDYVSFQGRIVRDDWLGQAAALARGGRDEYVRVYGKEPR